MSSNPQVANLEAPKLFEVKGLVAVVSGGGTGIGLMAAQTLAANGARVYVVGRREELLHVVAQKYSGNGQIIPCVHLHNHQITNSRSPYSPQTFRLPGDIAHTSGIKALTAQLTQDESKGINILINNAGVSPEHTAVADYTHNDVNFSDPHSISSWMTRDGVEAWNTAYAGNVACHHFFTAALLPLLDKGRQATPGMSSSVVNIASVAAITKTHSRGQFAYSSAKAALLHLTHEWASAFVPLRVRVNCIAPGLFPTEMTTGGSNRDLKSELGVGAGKDFPAGMLVLPGSLPPSPSPLVLVVLTCLGVCRPRGE